MYQEDKIIDINALNLFNFQVKLQYQRKSIEPVVVHPQPPDGTTSRTPILDFFQTVASTKTFYE